MLSLPQRPLCIGMLPQGLRKNTAELILRYAALARHAKDDEVRAALSTYNRYIIDFLKFLPKGSGMADRLFDAYELNDPLPFRNISTSASTVFNRHGYHSGYTPFCEIMNSDVPEKWKERAEEKMQGIVTAEVVGRAKPRMDLENALACYASLLQLPLEGSTCIRYSAGLFAIQLGFILGLPTKAIRDKELFRPLCVSRIFQIVAEEKYRNLRHRFARHLVLQNTARYWQSELPDLERIRLLRMILDKFGSDDPTLADAIKPLLAEAERSFGETSKSILAGRAQRSSAAQQVM